MSCESSQTIRTSTIVNKQIGQKGAWTYAEKYINRPIGTQHYDALAE